MWDEANKKALEIVSSTPGAQYVSPFDDPLIWSVFCVILYSV